MTLGNRIRTLRVAGDLSQPEFARKMGIEQSYLSKLENDKSIPSNDMFRQLLTAFSIEIAEFLEGVNVDADYARLSQIPDVEAFVSHKSLSQRNTQRKILYASCLMIVLSAAFFYAGFTKQLFSENIHLYESKGVVFEDEPNDVFRRWRFMIDDSLPNAGERINAKRLEMEKRIDDHLLHSTEFRGQEFTMDVENGRRYYYLDKTISQPRKINSWLQIFGVILIVAGTLGFVLERRWPKLQ